MINSTKHILYILREDLISNWLNCFYLGPNMTYWLLASKDVFIILRLFTYFILHNVDT